MSDTQKQIMLLNKQNEGMENSFKNKNIEFTKVNINNVDPDTELKLLKDYNEYLKNISKNNRPPTQPKENKIPVQQEKKEKQINFNEDETEDEIIKEEKISFLTLCNLEDAKRAFFSKEYDLFENIIKEHQTNLNKINNKLRFYKANYKWADDNTGKPDFAARNLLRGFVQGLDNYRKYLMVCFRCILINAETKSYRYPSYWIVNTDVDMKTLLGSLYDNYDFIIIKEEDTNKMFEKMRKNEDENDVALIGEVYLH